MSEPFLGQIMTAGFNFAPRGWAFCNGQILSIQQNTALFSLLGTTYGGNGVSTFALPNLQSRVPVHVGQGPGLTARVLGELGGEEKHTLLVPEMPMHNHLANAAQSANQSLPTGFIWGGDGTGTLATFSNGAPDSTLSPQAIGISGGSQPHNNLQPYLAFNFCIALSGVFPSRN